MLLITLGLGDWFFSDQKELRKHSSRMVIDRIKVKNKLKNLRRIETYIANEKV